MKMLRFLLVGLLVVNFAHGSVGEPRDRSCYSPLSMGYEEGFIGLINSTVEAALQTESDTKIESDGYFYNQSVRKEFNDRWQEIFNYSIGAEFHQTCMEEWNAHTMNSIDLDTYTSLRRNKLGILEKFLSTIRCAGKQEEVNVCIARSVDELRHHRRTIDWYYSQYSDKEDTTDEASRCESPNSEMARSNLNAVIINFTSNTDDAKDPHFYYGQNQRDALKNIAYISKIEKDAFKNSINESTREYNEYDDFDTIIKAVEDNTQAQATWCTFLIMARLFEQLSTVVTEDESKLCIDEAVASFKSMSTKIKESHKGLQENK